MARQRRDYKAEYAKRIARALAQGKTRQQGRGHVPRENYERRERQRAERGIAWSDERHIREWWRRNQTAARIDAGWPDLETLVEDAATKGFDWFKSYRSQWDDLRRQYVKRQKRGEHGPFTTLGALEIGSETLDLPDISWLFYH